MHKNLRPLDRCLVVSAVLGVLLTCLPYGCMKPQEGSSMFSRNRVCTSGAASSTARDPIEFVAAPKRDGYEYGFVSNVLAFNVTGTYELAPYGVDAWACLRLPNGSFGLCVFDLRTGTSLVLTVPAGALQAESPVTLNVEVQGGDSQAWILRHENSQAQDVRRDWVGSFNAHSGADANSTEIVPLQGTIVAQCSESVVQRIEVKELVSIREVQADHNELRQAMRSLQTRIEGLQQKLDADPGNEVARFTLEQARKEELSLEQIVATDRRLPLKLSDGRIEGGWISRLPRDLDLP